MSEVAVQPAPPLDASDAAGIKRNRHDALDILKALAIFGVIAQHCTGTSVRVFWGEYWIEPAVPIFVILMGLNAAGSLARRAGNGMGYTRKYAVDRFRRIFVPFAIVWLASLWVGNHYFTLNFDFWLYLGVMPLQGPGEYFVTVVVGFAMVFPFLFWLFRRAPTATTIALVGINVAFEVIAPHVAPINAGQFLHTALLFRYLGAIAVGMWMWRAGWPLSKGAIAVVLTGGVCSVAYLAYIRGRPDHFAFMADSFTKDTNIFTLGLAALIIVAVRIAIPGQVRSLPGRALVLIGKASFHIYLVQMLWCRWIGLTAIPDRDRYWISMLVCGAIGIALMYLETHAGSFLRRAVRVRSIPPPQTAE